MRVSVVRPDELGSAEVSAWRALQASAPAFDNPFLSPGFATAVARLRPATRVAVIEDDNRPAAFLPFEAGRFGVGRPVAPGVSDAQALIRVDGFECSGRDLLRACRLDVMEFDHLIAHSWPIAAHTIVARPSSVIDVTNGYDEYLAERKVASKKIITTTLAKQRKLERDVGGVCFEFDSRDAAALDLVLSWKSAQYRRTGRRDRFAVAWIERLVRDLFESPGDGCAGTLSVLSTARGVAAAHFGLRSDSTLACWFPAYDVTLAKYSPGLMLHLLMAAGAAADRIHRLDLGKGDEEYKASLRNAEHLVGEGWIDRPSATAVARRARRAPGRWTNEILRRYPQLRAPARRVLARAGELRNRWRP